MASVVELVHYPIKGCAGVSVSEAAMTPAGLRHDRSYLVIDGDGAGRTQRRDPRLAAITPKVVGDRLLLGARDADPVEVEGGDTEVPVTLFGSPYRGVDQGDAAAAWLTRYLGSPSRLVRVPADHDRVIDGPVPGTSGYADSCPVHLLSRASLDGLTERVLEHGGEPVGMERFRPNIVVDGWAEPNTEDRALRVTIGDIELAFNRPAIRCAVVLVDQFTGRRLGPEPLRTLARYRRVPDGGVSFGAKYTVVRTGKVSVGDEVVVTEWA